MAKKSKQAAPAATSAPAQEPEINEADGEPIYHDPGEEGDGDE